MMTKVKHIFTIVHWSNCSRFFIIAIVHIFTISTEFIESHQSMHMIPIDMFINNQVSANTSHTIRSRSGKIGALLACAHIDRFEVTFITNYTFRLVRCSLFTWWTLKTMSPPPSRNQTSRTFFAFVSSTSCCSFKHNLFDGE